MANVVPGDTEMLDRVRERCDLGEVRAAGATCLVEADLAGGPSGCSPTVTTTAFPTARHTPAPGLNHD